MLTKWCEVPWLFHFSNYTPDKTWMALISHIQASELAFENCNRKFLINTCFVFIFYTFILNNIHSLLFIFEHPWEIHSKIFDLQVTFHLKCPSPTLPLPPTPPLNYFGVLISNFLVALMIPLRFSILKVVVYS